MTLSRRLLGFVARARRLWFHQPDPIRRVARVRRAVAIVCILVLFGIHPRFEIEAAYGQRAILGNPRTLLGFLHVPLHCIAITSGIVFALGVGGRRIAVVFTASFFALTAHALWLTPYAWSYLTHLHFFLLALLLAPDEPAQSAPPTPAQAQRASFVLTFLQTFVAVLYLQAGLSKLLHGGPGWFSSGDTVRAVAALSDRWLARTALAHPALFPIFGLITAGVELGFAPLFFLVPRIRRWLWLPATAFHLGIYALSGISFWHLWVLFPALFWPASLVSELAVRLRIVHPRQTEYIRRSPWIRRPTVPPSEAPSSRPPSSAVTPSP